MSVLVTGGAGYIGSHMIHALLDRGESVVVLDNLSTGLRSLVAEGAHFVLGNAGDGALVESLLAKHKVDAVIHFAGSIVVPDSVTDPLGYYENNTVTSRALIAACVRAGVRNFFLDSHDLWCADQRRDTGKCAFGADQSLWPLQADDRMDVGGCGQSA